MAKYLRILSRSSKLGSTDATHRTPPVPMMFYLQFSRVFWATSRCLYQWSIPLLTLAISNTLNTILKIKTPWSLILPLAPMVRFTSGRIPLLLTKVSCPGPAIIRKISPELLILSLTHSFWPVQPLKVYLQRSHL